LNSIQFPPINRGQILYSERGQFPQQSTYNSHSLIYRDAAQQDACFTPITNKQSFTLSLVNFHIISCIAALASKPATGTG